MKTIRQTVLLGVALAPILLAQANGALAGEKPNGEAASGEKPNATTAFLGPESQWPRCGIALQDIQGLWGGTAIYLEGSGVCLIRIVHHQNEKRFTLKLSLEETTALRKACIEADLLTVQIKDRPGMMDEARPRIILRNAEGKTHELAKWVSDAIPRFDQVYKPLLALRKKTENLKPKYEGEYQRDWKPVRVPGTKTSMKGWELEEKEGKLITFYIKEPRTNVRGQAFRLGNDFFAVPKKSKVAFASRVEQPVSRTDKEAAMEEIAEPTTFGITLKKPADQVKVKVEKDTATFDVSSQSGIGSATITFTQGKWPTTVVLRLHLRGLESFSASNGKVILRGAVASHSGNPKRLYLTEDGKSESREPETEIKVLDAAGKPVKGLPGKGGCFEIRLPKALLEGEPKALELGWIDFFRG